MHSGDREPPKSPPALTYDVRTRRECSTLPARIHLSVLRRRVLGHADQSGDRELIASAGDMRLEWTASGAAEAHRLLKAAFPDVLLVDIGLPDVGGGSQNRVVPTPAVGPSRFP